MNCGNCRFNTYSDNEWCCGNEESENYGVPTMYDDSCDDYMEKDDVQQKGVVPNPSRLGLYKIYQKQGQKLKCRKCDYVILLIRLTALLCGAERRKNED